MMSFRGGRLRDFAIPAGSVWLMTDIAEASVARRVDESAKRAADLLLPKITHLIERKFAELTETLVLLNRKA